MVVMAKNKALESFIQKEDTALDAKTTSPMAIVASLLILVSYYFDLSYSKNIWLISATVAVIILFALSNYIPKLQFSRNHLPYLISYHCALAFMLIFVMPTLSYNFEIFFYIVL